MSHIIQVFLCSPNFKSLRHKSSWILNCLKIKQSMMLYTDDILIYVLNVFNCCTNIMDFLYFYNCSKSWFGLWHKIGRDCRIGMFTNCKQWRAGMMGYLSALISPIKNVQFKVFPRKNKLELHMPLLTHKDTFCGCSYHSIFISHEKDTTQSM